MCRYFFLFFSFLFLTPSVSTAASMDSPAEDREAMLIPGLEHRQVKTTNFYGISGYRVVPTPDLPDGTQDCYHNHWGQDLKMS